MIRFIDLGKQYWGDTTNIEDDNDYRESFAFIDTTTDTFVEVGERQFWDCWEDFEDDYTYCIQWDDRVKGGKVNLGRFKSLVSGKFFRPSDYG